jgi:AcrR family transcriptional regulator
VSASLDGSASARQTQRYARKKEAVVSAASHLFNVKGVRGTTLADVAAAVGLRTTGITYYYARRDALAVDCFLQGLATMQEVVADASIRATPAARIRSFVRGYVALRAGVTLGQRTLVSFSEVRAIARPQIDPVIASYNDMFRRVRALFKGASSGPNGAEERRRRGARAHALLSAVLWMEAWLGRYPTDEFERVADQFCDIMANGLAVGSLPSGEGLELVVDRSDHRKVSRQAFLRAATDLINELGYHGASVEKIAARLAVTKGSFYHHNDDKDDLVTACFQRTFALTRLAQRAATRGGANGLDKLWTAAAMLVRHQLAGGEPLLRSSALKALPPAPRAHMLRLYGRLSNGFAAFIAEGVADGSVRAVDPYVAAQTVVSTINATVALRRWAPGVDADEALEIFLAPLFTGIARGA